MASRNPGILGKRLAGDLQRSVSPPPSKKAAITKAVVADFFKPISEKAKNRAIWGERSPEGDKLATLLVANYIPAGYDEKPVVKRRKVAAFDLDSTLIIPASGKKHASNAKDWKWWNASVPSRVRQLYEDGFLVVIFSNQAGLTLHPDPKSKPPRSMKERVSNFKQKCSTVLERLDIPITLYAATGRDTYRKPRPGMWHEMRQDYGLNEAEIDRSACFLVGDAGGRIAQIKGGTAIAKDFSCSDRNLAHNIGIAFQTPEEFFLGEEPRSYARDFDLEVFPFSEDEGQTIAFEKPSEKDIVLFCGPPGAGKSTFYWKYLKALGYERVNQDTLKTDKCFQAAAEHLSSGNAVVIDNTNPDRDTRAQWVNFARKHKSNIRCVWFTTPRHVCEHNDAVRSGSKTLNPEARQVLPKIAFNSFTSRFMEPIASEGFREILRVDFKFRGSQEDYSTWGQYWT